MINERILVNKYHHNLPLAISGINLDQIILDRSIRMFGAIMVAISLLYLVALLPGLFFLILPGEIAILGKGYDEGKVIHLLRYGESLMIECWEDTESQTEGIRIKSSDNRNITLTSAR
jgi:hypothetical protein